MISKIKTVLVIGVAALTVIWLIHPYHAQRQMVHYAQSSQGITDPGYPDALNA